MKEKYYIYEVITAVHPEEKYTVVSEKELEEGACQSTRHYRCIEEHTNKELAEKVASQLNKEWEDDYCVYAQTLSCETRLCIDHSSLSNWNSLTTLFRGSLKDCLAYLEELEGGIKND